MKVKLTNKNNKAAKCASTYAVTESNFIVFMPEFYGLKDQNYTYQYSGSHTNTITYSDLQVNMPGFLSTITLHSSGIKKFISF